MAMNITLKRTLAHVGAIALFVGWIGVAQAQMIDGVVTKIDQPGGKITIRHGPMKKFDMDDGMTMVFRVKDPAMLKTVKQGDKVKFEADRINGQFTVTRIERAR